MARTSSRLPDEFPVGSTYVVEARGSVQGFTLMHRYVRFPDGRKVELAARFVRPCGAPQVAAGEPSKAPVRRRGTTARSRERVPARAG